MTPQPKRLLDRALTRLRRGWCQQALALDAKGTPCEPHAADAVKWCATGAVCEALYHVHGVRHHELVGAGRKQTFAQLQASPHRNHALYAEYVETIDLLTASISELLDPAYDTDFVLEEDEAEWAVEPFNDHAACTQSHVIALFSLAARKAQQKEKDEPS